MLGHSLRHFNFRCECLARMRTAGTSYCPPSRARTLKTDGRQHVAIGGRKGDGVDEDAFHAVSVTAISRLSRGLPATTNFSFCGKGLFKQTVREL